VTVHMSKSFHQFFKPKLFSVHFMYYIYHHCIATEKFGSKVILSLLV